MRRALPLALLLFACATTGPAASPGGATVTQLQLTFSDGKGDLSFAVQVPGFHDPTDVHWQLFLDDRAIASGVAVVQPQQEKVSVSTPLRPRGLRFDDGARFVRIRLEGDAAPELVFANPLAFSYQREQVLTGAPVP